MFELPSTDLGQAGNETLRGRRYGEDSWETVPQVRLYNRSHDEFERLTRGRHSRSTRKRKWLFVPLEPGYVLLLASAVARCCISLLVEGAGEVPSVHRIRRRLLSHRDHPDVGAMELFEEGAEQERQYVKGMRSTPVEPEFTFDYFCALVAGLKQEKRSVKALLTQDQLILAWATPSLRKSCSAPGYTSTSIDDLDERQLQTLYDATRKTVDMRSQVVPGRRVDLHNQPGVTGA